MWLIAILCCCFHSFCSKESSVDFVYFASTSNVFGIHLRRATFVWLTRLFCLVRNSIAIIARRTTVPFMHRLATNLRLDSTTVDDGWTNRNRRVCLHVGHSAFLFSILPVLPVAVIISCRFVSSACCRNHFKFCCCRPPAAVDGFNFNRRLRLLYSRRFCSFCFTRVDRRRCLFSVFL